MKILILHQHFKTPRGGGAIRSYYLAKALVEMGIETVVITAHNGSGKRNENVEGISVQYLPIAYDNRFGFNKRIISFFRFMRTAATAAAQHRDACLCYAISTPLTAGWAARIILRRYGIPYIFEVGDLWPDAPVEMGFVKSGIVKKFLYRMEKAIYTSATSIVALSHPIRDVIVQKIPGKTVHVLPNMSDLEFFKPERKPSALEERFGLKDKFVVSYIGALGVANGLHYFLDCASVSQREGLSVHFILCGEGAMTDELKAYARRLSLTNLSFIPFQNREGVGEIMGVTDANFISYLPVRILETGSPNKYFDGLAAGKLTIVNFGGWVKEEIEREGCGIYVDPNDAGDFVKKITPFLEDKQIQRRYEEAGRALAQRKYSRVMLGERFREIVGARQESVSS